MRNKCRYAEGLRYVERQEEKDGSSVESVGGGWLR
jgi:hypothetical protein